jgi:hypothetical protein
MTSAIKVKQPGEIANQPIRITARQRRVDAYLKPILFPCEKSFTSTS